MATAKKTSTVPAKNSAKSAKTTAPAAAGTGKTGAIALKPIKSAFNRTALTSHLAGQAGVEPKVVKAVLAALESTILASVHKKGLGEFTLHGLLKLAVVNVPAKKKRLGKDPFTGVERMFAAKPASVKIKARALKKLKDAAL